MAWQKGPLPKGTFGWGGVVPVGESHVGHGFYFADFKGDSVRAIGGAGGHKDAELGPHDVAWFDNSLTLPPKE